MHNPIHLGPLGQGLGHEGCDRPRHVHGLTGARPLLVRPPRCRSRGPWSSPHRCASLPRWRSRWTTTVGAPTGAHLASRCGTPSGAAARGPAGDRAVAVHARRAPGSTDPRGPLRAAGALRGRGRRERWRCRGAGRSREASGARPGAA
ncbi:hypothetical protein QJS66_07360 [Kocuria rhizophila]|nr:hypothetical protein QJS66_07360 [Kocuria rhizophila]